MSRLLFLAFSMILSEPPSIQNFHVLHPPPLAARFDLTLFVGGAVLVAALAMLMASQDDPGLYFIFLDTKGDLRT